MKRSIIVLVFIVMATAAGADTAKDPLSLGFEYLGRAEYEKAEAEFQKVLSADSTSARAHYGIAQVYGGQGRHKEAIESYRRSAELEPNRAANCWGIIGWEYYLLGDYEASADASQKALSLDSKLGYVWYNLGLAQLVQRQIEDAVHTYEEASAVDSTFRAFRGATNDLYGLFEEKPDLGEAHYILGMLNLKRGWKYGAREELKKYITLSPGTALAEHAEASLDTIKISMNRRLRNAISVWEDYMEAVREGDKEKARRYWSKNTRRRYPSFDWQLPFFDEAVDLVRNQHLAVVNLKEHEDHIELLVASPRREFTYHLIRERRKTLLTNPIEVFTKGWRKKETKSFVCHYTKGNGPTPLQIKKLDEFYKELSAYLGLSLEKKIDYYKCDSVKEVSKVFGMPPAVGRGSTIHRAIAAMSWGSFHEVVHVLLGQICRKKPNSLVIEGSACYFGGTSVITKEAQLSWAKTLVENNEHLTICDISQEDGFWSADDMNDPYAEAGSFAKYLVDTYGIGKFKELYKYRDTTEDLEAEIKRIYGKNIAQLEKEWEEWLLRLDLPKIEVGGSDTAEEIFSMEDPPYDDTGNGDYTYPLGSRYKPGIFDLTGFRVLKEKERVYFELRYRDLAEWEESSEWGFGGTYTRIAIDCQSQGAGGFQRDAHATLSGNCDCLINISDCGILLWWHGRIAGLLKRIPDGKKLGDSQSESITFSIPYCMMEEPQKNWKYAVAVGGCFKGGKRLFDGTGLLVEVGKSPSEETGGGGLDTDINPNIYDILLPPGKDQEKILGSYDPKRGRLVVLPMVGQ
ncbi:MAG: tetratricopeptide repeat protein [Candidatus Latescibacterota bacterium]|nr:MAG: tetratricopeptide repeat protein [Candidatus Latescibacterota bacterium]